MKIGPLEINLNFGQKKTYNQLSQIIEREKLSFDTKTSPKKQLAEYRSWAASAVSLISDRVSTVPYRFYRKDTKEEITPNIHSYKLFSKPFLNPNPLMSFRFIKSFCQMQLDMCGMGCIYKAKNVLGQIWELWPLNMNDFMGAYGPDGMPIEFNSNILPSDVIYVFMIGGKEYAFSNKELIILMYPHPTNMFIGASPIQQQAYAIDIQHYVEIYERDFFANSARVDMVLKTEQDVDTTKADEIKQRWTEKFRGKYHDIVVLGSGLEPVPLKYTNKDFEFLELSKWTKDMILSAYRINPSKLGNSVGVNRSNSVFIDIDFNKDCIQPRLTIWDEECTKEVLSSFDPRIEMRHDNPIPRDRQIETQEARIYLSGVPVLTVNEFRKDYRDAPSQEGGDEIYIPAKYIPLSMAKDYAKALIESMKQPKFGNSETDPTRHDGDKPHVNPDGTDDRDELPTSGRALNEFENKLKEIWLTQIENYLISEEITEKRTIELITTLFYSTNKFILKQTKDYENLLNSKDNEWIKSNGIKYGKEFYNTLIKEAKEKELEVNSDYYITQLNCNSRIAKICNAGLKSVINYTKFVILDYYNLKRKWVINNNVCGHRGRVKNFESDGKFIIGISEVNFPGETINLNCDCDISISEGGKIFMLLGGSI